MVEHITPKPVEAPSGPILLAVDTATEACSVAVSLRGQIHERFELAGRSHTQRLQAMAAAALQDAGLSWPQLQGIVCGIGPGSFAGIRIGLGYAKGLALALDLPLIGVSSLAMLAQSAIDAGAERVLACIDAKTQEVHFGAYLRDAEGLAQALQDEIACLPGEVRLLRPAAGFVGIGSGWARYGAQLGTALGAALQAPPAIQAEAWPHAADALRLALPQWHAGQRPAPDTLVPRYLRDRVALTLEEQAIARQANRG